MSDPAVILILAMLIALVAARVFWVFDRGVRRAKQATRAARSSGRASKMSVRFSSFGEALSVASSQASARALQAESWFGWRCWSFYGKALLLFARWFIGIAVRLRDRARAKLESCDAILDSLGVKHDA
jgi:hypothetical protein